MDNYELFKDDIGLLWFFRCKPVFDFYGDCLRCFPMCSFCAGCESWSGFDYLTFKCDCIKGLLPFNVLV